jgi:hypothetical protein
MKITVVTRVDWIGTGEETYVAGAFLHQKAVDKFMKTAPCKDDPDSKYEFHDFEAEVIPD